MIGSSGLFRFDIGADEFTGVAQTNRQLATQPADFTLIGPGNPTDNPASDGSNDWIGYAASGGDVNGDHHDDLIVGAPNLSGDFDGGTNDDGRVFALYNNGTRRLGVTDLLTTSPSLEVRSWLHQQHIGRSFAASDLNGDAVIDRRRRQWQADHRHDLCLRGWSVLIGHAHALADDAGHISDPLRSVHAIFQRQE
jgi:hypothetical protein